MSKVFSTKGLSISQYSSEVNFAVLSCICVFACIFIGCMLNTSKNDIKRNVSLETLYLMSINIPLDSLLTNMVNLKNLYIGESFNQELNSSLSTLVNLQLLEFSNYHRLLGNSLDKLVNLHTLNGIVTKVPEDVMENYRKQKHGKKYVNESLKRSLKFLPKLRTVNEKPYTSEIFSGLI